MSLFINPLAEEETEEESERFFADLRKVKGYAKQKRYVLSYLQKHPLSLKTANCYAHMLYGQESIDFQLSQLELYRKEIIDNHWADFKKDKGDFYLIRETRKYMLALLYLMYTYIDQRRDKEAIDIIHTILEYNSNDNLGVREQLAIYDVIQDDLEGIEKLEKRFPGDMLLGSSFAYAYLDRRKGKPLDEVRKALADRNLYFTLDITDDLDLIEESREAILAKDYPFGYQMGSLAESCLTISWIDNWLWEEEETKFDQRMRSLFRTNPQEPTKVQELLSPLDIVLLGGIVYSEEQLDLEASITPSFLSDFANHLSRYTSIPFSCLEKAFPGFHTTKKKVEEEMKVMLNYHFCEKEDGKYFPSEDPYPIMDLFHHEIDGRDVYPREYRHSQDTHGHKR